MLRGQRPLAPYPWGSRFVPQHGSTECETFFPQSSYPKAKGGTIMYCNACGKDIAEDGRFCSYCGNVVGIRPTPGKLTRSHAERKIAGVCAGLAQYFDLDVSLV